MGPQTGELSTMGMKLTLSNKGVLEVPRTVRGTCSEN